MAQVLHAILAAEMIDNAGWEILIELTRLQKQNALLTDFSIALDEERSHLQLVKTWYEEAILGKPLSATAATAPQRH